MPKAGVYQMFDEEEGIYNYCPSPVCTDEETMYIFFCANTWPGIVIDDIYARKGKLVDGTWQFGDKFRVIEPSRLGWDNIHVCDPDVIQGEFRYKGETYPWMMVFLGCDIHYSYHNQIGVAFAKEIEGPYVKYDGNPIVNYEEVLHWGAGQPCVISLDGKGKFRMLYTQSVHEYERRLNGTRTFWRDFDLSDADHPIITEEVAMHEGGITNKDKEGAVAVFNPSLMWDRQQDLYYLTREGTPFDREHVPGFISSYSQVCVISRQNFERNEGGWQVLYNIDQGDTGFPRNHNAGLIKDAFGWQPQGRKPQAAVTVSELKDQGYLWTYRIYYKEIQLEEQS